MTSSPVATPLPMPLPESRRARARAWTRARSVALVLIAACSAKAKETGDHVATGTGTSASGAIDDGGAIAPEMIDAAAVVLAPAPPPPKPLVGLPAADSLDVRGEAVVLGELLFFDPRLSASGTTSCATCHDPDHGWADLAPHATIDGGQPDLRRTPAIANLAWARGGFAWDGRYDALTTLIGAHWKGQLGQAPADAIAKLAGNPTYAAHLARQPAGAPADQAIAALAAFVLTRYQGDSPWDRFERGDRLAVPPPAIAGYALFTGKAQCSVCHVPPLYTDLGFHRLGLIAVKDEGRGRVDPSQAGAFKTPSLRGAALHPPYFHDGSARTVLQAIIWHVTGGTGQGADRSIIDPALQQVALSDDELRALEAFVKALSPATRPASHRPELPR